MSNDAASEHTIQAIIDRAHPARLCLSAPAPWAHGGSSSNPLDHANPVEWASPPASHLNPMSFPCHREPLQRQFTSLNPMETHAHHVNPVKKAFILAGPPDAAGFLLLSNPHTQKV